VTTAVVSGSASGIGAAVAARLRSEGARVIGIDLRGADVTADLGTAEGREALRVVQERRQAGMATLTDELETEAASLAAELGELSAAADTALADAALARAAGGI